MRLGRVTDVHKHFVEFAQALNLFHRRAVSYRTP